LEREDTEGHHGAKENKYSYRKTNAGHASSIPESSA
jgi:hypothetical protein